MLKWESQNISALYVGAEKIKRAYWGGGLVFDSAPVYTVSVSADPAGSGTVSGAGSYHEGQTVTVTAQSADGLTFTAWQENGETVSEEASYTFTAGGDRELVAVFAAVPASRLPEGYTELEYIVSNSATYIDSGVKPGSASRTVVDAEIAGTGSAASLYFIYSYLSKTTNTASGGIITYYFHYSLQYSVSSGRCYAGLGRIVSTLSGGNSFPLPAVSANRLLVEINSKTSSASVNGESSVNTSMAGESVSYSYDSTMPAIRLCGSGSNTTANVRIFSAQIYTNDTLVRDFVPCTNPDGEVGMYDLAGNTFYKNANTSYGAFAAGPAV